MKIMEEINEIKSKSKMETINPTKKFCFVWKQREVDKTLIRFI